MAFRPRVLHQAKGYCHHEPWTKVTASLNVLPAKSPDQCPHTATWYVSFNCPRRRKIASQSAVKDLLSSLDTTRLLHTSLSSQYRLLDFETHSIGKLLGTNSILANELTSTFSKFTRSYRDVIECIPKLLDLQIATIAKISPIEYSLELNVLEHISVEDEEAHENEPCGLPDVDEELASFDSRLLALINGARQSLESDNPDRARHVTTSVRELFMQLLHGLAPDAEIKQ